MLILLNGWTCPSPSTGWYSMAVFFRLILKPKQLTGQVKWYWLKIAWGPSLNPYPLFILCWRLFLGKMSLSSLSCLESTQMTMWMLNVCSRGQHLGGYKNIKSVCKIDFKAVLRGILQQEITLTSHLHSRPCLEEPAQGLMVLPLKSMGIWSQGLVQEDTKNNRIKCVSAVVVKLCPNKGPTGS